MYLITPHTQQRALSGLSVLCFLVFSLSSSNLQQKALATQAPPLANLAKPQNSLQSLHKDIHTNFHTSIHWREDVLKHLQPRLCSQKITRNTPPQHIYQLAEQTLKNSEIAQNNPGAAFLIITLKKQNATTKLHKLAQTVAKKHHHLGVAWGICQSFAWLVTTVAPVSPNHPNLKQALKSNCKRYALRSTPSHVVATSSQDLLLAMWLSSDHHIYTALSLVCHPKTPSWIGAQTWFTRKGTLTDPLQTTLKTIPEHLPLTKKHLLALTNTFRKQQKLSSIAQADTTFTSLISTLNQNTSLTHNHQILQALAKQTKHHAPTLVSLSEIRLQASYSREAFTKILQSPPHRAALLDPRAKAAAIMVTPTSDSKQLSDSKPPSHFVLIVTQNHDMTTKTQNTP